MTRDEVVGDAFGYLCAFSYLLQQYPAQFSKAYCDELIADIERIKPLLLAIEVD